MVDIRFGVIFKEIKAHNEDEIGSLIKETSEDSWIDPWICRYDDKFMALREPSRKASSLQPGSANDWGFVKNLAGRC